MRLFLVLFFSFIGIQGWAARVDLYPKTEVMSIPLTTLAEADPFVQEALSNGPNVSGWYSGLYKGPWMGFVKGAAVVGQNQVLPGTLVYAMPQVDSMVLARIEAKDDVNADPDPDWVNVTLQKPIMLYFKQAAALAPVSPQAAPPVAALSRDLEGQFLTCGKTFMGTRYDYQLVNDKSECIALLDVSRCVLASNLRSYIGQKVVVQGMIRDIGRHRTVQVLSLRLL